MRKWINLFESDEITYTFTHGPDTIEMFQGAEYPFERIPYFFMSEAYRESHFIAWIDNQVVGVGGIQINPNNPKELWGKFVGVDPDFRGRKIGSTLLRKMIAYAQENNQTFVPSSYSQDGEIKMKPIIDRIASHQ